MNSDKDLKNADTLNIVSVFQLLENDFTNYIKSEFVEVDSQPALAVTKRIAVVL